MNANQETLTMPSETPTETPENANAPQPKKTHWLRRILITVFVVLLSLAGFIGWLISTESGLRFGLHTLPSWLGVQIRSKNLQGTFLKGFNGDKWRIETESSDLDISSIVFAWQPKELWQKKLHINRIALGDIHITPKDAPPKESTPAKMPESVKLPIEAAIDSIEVGKITSGSNQALLLQHLLASYQYNHQLHHLRIPDIQTPWLNGNGESTLALKKPFKISTILNGEGILDDTPVNSALRLYGTLQDVSTDITIEGGDVRLWVESVVHPFGAQLNDKIERIEITGVNINPRAFVSTLPKADLTFNASLLPVINNDIALEGSIDLTNKQAATVDTEGIPVRSLLADFTVNNRGLLTIGSAKAALLQKGTVDLSGKIQTNERAIDLTATLTNIASTDALAQTFPLNLNGSVKTTGSFDNPETAWQIDSGTATSTGILSISTDTRQGQRTLLIKEGKIQPKGGGEMKFAGKLELFQKQLLDVTVNSVNFNPNKLHPNFPSGSVNGNIKLTGELAEQVFNGKMLFGPSTLSGVPLRGSADVLYQQQHLSQAVTDILLGRNRIKTNGSFGKAGDRLNLDINAPDLDKFGFGLNGLLTARGYIAGEPSKIEANLSGQARNLRLSSTLQVNNLDFKLQGSPDYNRPLNVELQGNKIIIPGQAQPTTVDTVNLAIKGTGHNHTIRGSGNMALSGKNYKLDIDAKGGLNNQNQWKGVLDILDISGAFNLKLQNRMTLEAGPERVSMSAARWAAMGGSLNLQSFLWDKRSGIATKGSANNLAISELHNFYTPPLEHNLVLSGDWDLSYSRDTRGYLNIHRQSGDIILPHRRQPLGLGALTLNTRFQNGRIDSTLDGVTAYGNLNGNLVISQQFGNDITQAPVNGSIRLNAPDLDRFRNLLPIGQSLKGSLIGNATISGRLGIPQLNGTLNGDNLYYRNREIGLFLDNGTLRSRLSGQKWLIDSLRFQRGGTVTLSGNVGLNQNSPQVNVTALFDRYQTLDQPNRRLMLSGDTRLIYTEKDGVLLTGTLKADRGYFSFQKGSMPTLGDDVVVLGEPPKAPATSTPINMNLTLDLNDSVRFSGEGLDVTLGGQLNLAAKPGQDVQGVGTVRVTKGRYKAYGQNLEISKGNISFVGPLSDPNLNIRAERRMSPVGAGIEVLGSLNNPRITLVADEPMSEKDKLSWLILNRPSSGSDSDEATLSAAAGALLAGQINDRIGLVDDFGFTSQRTRNAQTGELNPAEQVLTVGKQLTNELYLGYEYGVTSADQSVKLIYQLTRAIQAIARVGTSSSGGELKYIIRFD
ncbi:translocation/assembly module TamB domain-containing protein [Neisseria sp. S1]|uniref:translocation/assembly module TamB domain-containing protein n=1 Tax=Neisseria sp. S1 TaxID=3318354 RepID=UPI003A852542